MSLDHQIEDIFNPHIRVSQGDQQFGRGVKVSRWGDPPAFLTYMGRSVLTIYRRVVISQKANSILKKFTKEELLTIGNELVESDSEGNQFYRFINGASGMGMFLSRGSISPFKKHLTILEHKEILALLGIFKESLFKDFKKLPLLVNRPDIKPEAQAVYRARLSIGK